MSFYVLMRMIQLRGKAEDAKERGENYWDSTSLGK